ncbi:hypothetical protein BEL04_15595 [Mucilaginibacter sp. PPCGB 2223]|nr:hypothetical protein BEL04_15595 [Mucilaginibacter sp. PPCGB 2223]
MKKITNKAEANAAMTNCITLHLDMFKNVIDERNVDINDRQAMTKVGIDIGANMMKNGCEGFIKVSSILAQDEVDNKGETGTTSGVLKRIDNKGFNYFAITDINKSEKSFIWLREFPGSEKFTNGLGDYAGRKVKIKWDEIEVYLPAAKGYYKVKEIVELTLE